MLVRVLTAKAGGSTEDEVRQYVHSRFDKLGRIDAFCNNAGITLTTN